MEFVIELLFGALASIGSALLAANVLMTALKLSHKRDAARVVARRVYPYASYFRLGGTTAADSERSKHA